MKTLSIIGSPVSCLSLSQHTERIVELARSNRGSYVCVANVHMLMESHWDSKFRSVLQKAHSIAADGMPLVWIMRALGEKRQERVPGMKIFQSVCLAAESEGLRVALVGSEKHILERIVSRLKREYPNLMLSAVLPLPFRKLTSDEEDTLVSKLNQSSADIVFVSLGCPKQEKFMAKLHGRLSSTMIGVGGVFPIYAGLLPAAPSWVQSFGLEWLFRLYQEPKRLWKRYASTNFPFIYLALLQLLFEKFVPAKLTLKSDD